MRIVLFANTDWYLFNHRLSLARAARERNLEVILVSPGGPYADRLIADGFQWFELPMDRAGMNIMREILTIYRNIRLYQQIKPDLAHHFTVKPVFYGSLAARWLGVPAVVNSITGLGYLFIHHSPHVALIRQLLKPIYTRAMNHPNQKVIFQHQGDLDAYQTLGLVNPENAVIIPSSGVDLTRFQPKADPKGTPVILMATRMLWDKGIGDLIEATAQLKAGGIKVRVVLVGKPDEGNPTSIPEEQLQDWHSEGVVEWWGHQEDMPEIFAKSHIVVLPSHSEGVPKSLIEAAAMGKPIVATDLPGCREIVRNEWNGLLVPTNDAIALTKALERLMQDPALRKLMGENGRRIVEEQFADRIVNQRTMNIYDELLGLEEKKSSDE
jgi:glycosyltransferase involved in cell wall biosynthesis